MTRKERNEGCFGLQNLIYRFVLVASLILTIAALNGEDQKDEVINIQPSETVTETTQIAPNTILETWTHDQSSEIPILKQSDKWTEEQTQTTVSEPLELEPTAREISGTSHEYDKSVEPSFVESYTSQQEGNQQSSVETQDIPHSVYNDQSESPIVEESLEHKVEDKPDKSTITANEESEQHKVKEDITESATETVEEHVQTVDKVLPAEEEPKVDGQDEPGSILTATISKEEGLDAEVKKPVGVEVEDKSAEKPEEEGLTFNEWAQKVLAEEEKEKHHAKTETLTVASTKQRKKKNYALQECGAKILASNPEATNAKSVLNPNKDDYMINPCKVKKWFVVELCEPMQAYHVEMASLELFSSQPKSFKIYLSDRYPTKEWRFAGQHEMTEERTIQSFDVEEAEGYFAKFVRVELLDHYSNEHFCPLTMFRLFGVDYDISDGEEEEQEEQEQDDDEIISEEEEAGDSKNLFSSAKDTVLKIVKKVLNVEGLVEEMEHHLNETTENINQNISAGENKTTTVDSEGLPCAPDTRLPVTGESQDAVSDGQQLESSKCDQTKDIKLVTKIEDDEQLETGRDSFLSDTKESDAARSLQSKIEDCFSCSNSTQSLFHSVPVTQLCIYLKFLLDKYKGQTCSTPIHTVKTESEHQVDEDHSRTSPQFSILTDSQQLPEESYTGKTESEEQSSIVHPSVTSSAIDNELSLDQTLLTPADSSLYTDKSSANIVTDSETATTAEILPEHTKVVVEPTAVEFGARETLVPTQTVLVQQSEMHESSIKSGTSVVSETSPKMSVISSASDKIDPSPTAMESRETILSASVSREATPLLPGTGSFRPDAAGVVTESTDAGLKVDQVSSDKVLPEATSVTVTEAPSVDSSASVAVEPPLTDQPEIPSQEPPEHGTHERAQQIEDDGAQITNQTSETVVEKPDMKPDIKPDVKPVVDGSKQKELNLVKVPIVPLSKRESAIMRLNNRIKVLEQNVSLSTRFLEELSKRYKKQSEDMMKMLNRTVARLNNVTLEAEIKDKLHDDAISIMESRLHNLTATVTELTVKLDVLNKQVTDRQMIWTSIELIVIMIIMIIMLRRGKTPTLTPEIKEMIESMPTQPTRPPYRRNSLSGPATPLKSKSDLDPGPSLQRFSSETTLVHCDYPVIEPGEPPFFTPQPKDGQKKKKKKKHKNLESRSHVGLKESNSDLGIEMRENLGQLSGSSISSAGVLFRGENNENHGPSLQKSDLMTHDKHFVESTRSQRSNSSVSCSSSGTSIGSSEFNVCDKGPTRTFSKKAGKLCSAYQSSAPSISGIQKPKSSPTLPRNDRSDVKTHKRQKSLPLTPSSRPSVENIGKVENQDLYKSDKEKNNVAQKPVGKTKVPGVRKSLSMTAASKGGKHTDNVCSRENKADQIKLGKGSQKQHNNNAVYNGAPESSKSKIGYTDESIYHSTDSTCDQDIDNRKGPESYSGLCIEGSKSSCHFDPGGAIYVEELNGYANNDHHLINGHSFNDLSHCNINEGVGVPLQNMGNGDTPTTKSGWRKLIGWF